MENNYQLSRIHNYVMGLMNMEEMHALEKEALEDPFLQDAIDGYKLQHGVDAMPLSLLQKRLAARIEQKATERNQRYYNWQRLGIGLVAAVMFVVVCSLILFRYINERQMKTTEVILMEEDYRIAMQEMEGSTAAPSQGWNHFNEELNSEIKEFKGLGFVRISFFVNNGKAREIQITGTNNHALVQVLQDFIEHKTQWKGDIAKLELTIRANQK